MSLRNIGDRNESFGFYDWELQDPNGVIKSPTFFGGDGKFLDSGDLAPGRKVSGEVCFEADARSNPGEYVALYNKLSFFDPGRLAWVNNF